MAEITLRIAGTTVDLGPKKTMVGTNAMGGNWISGPSIGLQIGPSADDER
jgi:hypothetical protein